MNYKNSIEYAEQQGAEIWHAHEAMAGIERLLQCSPESVLVVRRDDDDAVLAQIHTPCFDFHSRDDSGEFPPLGKTTQSGVGDSAAEAIAAALNSPGECS